MLGIAAMKQEVFAQVVAMGQAQLPVVGIVYSTNHVLGQSGIFGMKTGSGFSTGANFLFGATITVVELPTAFPYFAAIAAVVGSGLDPARQVVLLVLFNLCFVLPLVAIVVTLWLAGDRAQRILTSVRDFLQRRWPVLLSGLLLAAGVFIVLLGATALGSRAHNRFGHFLRRFHRVLRP